MTIREFGSLPDGTLVTWRKDGELDSGRKSHPVGVPAYIQWASGQKTEGNDDWALKYVSVATYGEPLVVSVTKKTKEIQDAKD
jgi:hypothetical protein